MIQKQVELPPASGAEVMETAMSDPYAEFVSHYPASRRVGGKPARRAFTNAMNAAGPLTSPAEHLAMMITAVEQHKRSEQWQNPALIPLMTTWLNQCRFVQVLPEAKRKIGQRSTGEEEGPL